MNSVEQNLTKIKKEITESKKISKLNNEPKVIVVTKYVTIERAIEAYDAGLRHFGENRIEGFQEKKSQLPKDAIFHFIGSLQTRKVKEVINDIDYFHALDRMKLAKEIEKRANHVVNCFVQVNVSGEESKQGIPPKEVISFIKSLEHYENIKVVGLMTMAPFIEDKAQIREYFYQLRELKNQVQKLNLKYAPCNELSMGMSNDFNEAIIEGSTFIRIGTKLVGE